jgi:hypothetical protein
MTGNSRITRPFGEPRDAAAPAEPARPPTRREPETSVLAMPQLGRGLRWSDVVAEIARETRDRETTDRKAA